MAAIQTGMPILPTLNIIALFFLGAFIMRSAGCIVNDILDRNIDAKVERTKSRPIASGTISVKRALILLITLLFAALIIVSQLRLEVFWLAVISLPLIAIYPLMKRITWWPQAFLGLTFNFGALMGWVAVTGEIALPAILLYFSGIFWTLGYDTIYAFQDINDDIKLGIKSTAIRLQKHAKLAISIFYSISFISYILALVVNQINIYIFILCLLPLSALIRQIFIFNKSETDGCKKLFISNGFVGFLTLLPIIAILLLN